jgi:hypothetical protein
VKRSAERWPNLFVVGAPRAATSSLWHYLRQHPEVFMSDPKETYFFTPARPRIVPSISDEKAYLRLFERAREPVVGEATPTYLIHPDSPASIQARSPDASIVISLREPGERAVSAYWHHVRYGIASPSFAERVDLDLDSGRMRTLAFSYADAVERFLERFERVHVLFVEELRQDVRGELRRLYEFAGVEPGFADEVDTTPRNSYGIPRNRLTRRLYRSTRLRSSVRRIVPTAVEHHVERSLLTVERDGEVDPAALARIRAVYEHDIPRLERLLGRSVPWDPP